MSRRKVKFALTEVFSKKTKLNEIIIKVASQSINKKLNN